MENHSSLTLKFSSKSPILTLGYERNSILHKSFDPLELTQLYPPAPVPL